MMLPSFRALVRRRTLVRAYIFGADDLAPGFAQIVIAFYAFGILLANLVAVVLAQKADPRRARAGRNYYLRPSAGGVNIQF